MPDPKLSWEASALTSGTRGQVLIALLLAVAGILTLSLLVIRSETFALQLISRAVGERAMSRAAGPDRCCETGFSSVRLGFQPLRIDITDFKLIRFDPEDERGGEVLLADVPLVTLGLDAGALWSNRPALRSVQVGEGSAHIAHSSDSASETWKIDLESVPIGLVRHLFGGAEDLSGVATGDVDLTGSLFRPDGVEVALVVEHASLRVKQFDIRGKIALDGHLSRGPRGLTGEFVIDATLARVDVANAYSKPAGTPGTISGKLAPDEQGRIEASEFNYQAQKAKVQITL